ncbi:putative major facilitator superfamily transporter [Trematosphaeria pertusa]|uniref:Putative major facilitator superfamily transporter n=1 Tax=Trematosphaeria pertusa TaxID=390896 RepID=A0A6A6IWI4_9PLEO|nr:putative major facilitator superfamily transporter [Trematosphaeria pertusa]KAF2253563.1 putative major facilitator superfamily transporter [Trematosphaeria pertusa]
MNRTRYSVFTKWQKRWVVFLVAVAGWFSTLSSFIFFPAIPTLARVLHTSVGRINLTVTSYLLVAAVAPTFIGHFADRSGRRPVYLICLTVYLISNISLACQTSFAALFTLRMLQSAGISGTFSITYGVVADLATPAERGTFVGIVAFGTNTAPSVGPVLGAAMNARAGWRWIFWILALLSGLCLAAISLSLPETARSVVGNGSVPAHGIHKVFISKMAGHPVAEETAELPPSLSRRWKFPNPLACLKMLLRKDSAIVLVALGIQYMTYTCLQASLSTVFMDIYGFNQLQAGLIYLPYGIGCATMAFCAGKILDRDYRITAQSRGLSVDKRVGEELLNFPIEEARLRSFFLPMLIAVSSIIGYGWALRFHAWAFPLQHFAIPLALQLFIGCSIQSCNTILNTLLMDLDQENASAAQACCNFVRCFLAAGALAGLQPLIDKVGDGFTFTFIGALTALCAPLLMLERRKGWNWRQHQRTSRQSTVPLRSVGETLMRRC